MAFTKKTWDLTTPITPTELNRVEQGIKDNETNLTDHENNTENPHSVTKSQVGLDNVDNTSDVDKPVSTAQQQALNNKVDKSTYNARVTTVDNELNNINDKIDQPSSILETLTNAIQITANGTAIKTSGLVKSIRGNTYTNLFDGELELGGITFADGQNYDAQSDRVRSVNYLNVESNKNYSITNNFNEMYVYFYDINKTFLSYTTVSNSKFTTVDSTKYIRFVEKGNTNINSNIMLNEGNTALAYVDGTKHVENPVIKSVGKNIVNPNNWETGTFDYSNGSKLPTPTRIRNTEKIKVLPNKDYIFSIINGYDIRGVLYDSSDNFVGLAGDWLTNYFTTPSNVEYLLINIRESNDNGVDVSDVLSLQPQLELGTTATEYKPYTETQLKFPTTLRGLDTVQDEIIENNGEFTEVRKLSDEINLWDFTGSIGESTAYANTYRFILYDAVNTYGLDNTSTGSKIISILYEASNTDKRHWYFGASNNDSLVIHVERSLIDSQTGSTLTDKFKEYLQSENIFGIFELATYTETQITPDNTELPNATNGTYTGYNNGQTELLSDFDVVPSVDVEYALNVAGQVAHLTKKDKQVFERFEKVDSVLGNKVDKVTGKGLSSNDYTDADKQKLNNLDENPAKPLIKLYYTYKMKTDGTGDSNLTMPYVELPKNVVDYTELVLYVQGNDVQANLTIPVAFLADPLSPYMATRQYNIERNKALTFLINTDLTTYPKRINFTFLSENTENDLDVWVFGREK